MMKQSKKVIASVLLLAITFTGSTQAYAYTNQVEDIHHQLEESYKQRAILTRKDIEYIEDIETFYHEDEGNFVSFRNKNSKYGFLDTSTGKKVPGNFDEIMPTEDGRVFFEYPEPVKLNGKWIYINGDGETLSSHNFDSVTPFYQGYAVVIINQKTYIMDTDFQLVEKCSSRYYQRLPFGLQFDTQIFYYSSGRFEDLSFYLTFDDQGLSEVGYYNNHFNNMTFFNGKAGKLFSVLMGQVRSYFTLGDHHLVILEDLGKYQLLEMTDYGYHYLTDAVYDEMSHSDGKIIYRKGDEWGYLYDEGIEFPIGKDKLFSNTPYLWGSQKEYITISGRSEAKTSSGYHFNGYNFINRQGKFLLDDYQVKVSDFSETGFAAINNQDGIVKIIDTKGKVVESLLFDTFSTPFDDKEILLLENKYRQPSYGVYDLKNHHLIDQGNTDYAYSKAKETLTFVKGALTGLMDRRGKVISSPKWTKEDQKLGYKIIKQGPENYVLMNKDSKVISKRSYKFLEKHQYNDAYITIREKSGYGLLNKEGKEIVEPSKWNNQILVFDKKDTALIRHVSKDPLSSSLYETEYVDLLTYENPSNEVVSKASASSIEKYNKGYQTLIKKIKNTSYDTFDFLTAAVEFGSVSENGMAYYLDEEGRYHFYNANSGYRVPGSFKGIKEEPSMTQRESDYFAYGYEPVMIDDQWVYIDINGNVVSKTFDQASHFVEGYAVVKDEYTRVINTSFETQIIENSGSTSFNRDYLRLGNTNFFYKSGLSFESLNSPSMYVDDQVDLLAVYDTMDDKANLYNQDGRYLYTVKGNILHLKNVDGQLLGTLSHKGKMALVKLDHYGMEFLTEPIYNTIGFIKNKSDIMINYRIGEEQGYLYPNKQTFKVSEDRIYSITPYKHGQSVDMIKLLTSNYSRSYDKEMNYLDEKGNLLFDDYYLNLSGISSSGYMARGDGRGEIEIVNRDEKVLKRLDYKYFTLLNQEGTLLLLENRSLYSTFAVYNLESNKIIAEGDYNYTYEPESKSISYVSGHLTGEIDLNGNVISKPRWKGDDTRNTYILVDRGFQSLVILDQKGKNITGKEYWSVEENKYGQGYLTVEVDYAKSIINGQGETIVSSISGSKDVRFTNDGKYALIYMYDGSIEVVSISK